MSDFLTMAEVMAMHSDQIERYGGAHGVRDPGLLEAALYRPQSGYYVDLIEEAAALWESLSQNHAFIDGNKRTAFAAILFSQSMARSLRLMRRRPTNLSQSCTKPTSSDSTSLSYGSEVM